MPYIDAESRQHGKDHGWKCGQICKTADVSSTLKSAFVYGPYRHKNSL